jgi:hypothetical protein
LSRVSWILIGLLGTFFILIIFIYQNYTDDTYKGMSIIIENEKDIPLYKGLQPTDHTYVIDGDQWEEIYHFYITKLLDFGWKVEYVQSALSDNDTSNDWSGFRSTWRKKGFDGELSIFGYYNKYDDQTEIIFDKTPIYNPTTWIEHIPESVCIYDNKKECIEVYDPLKIQIIVDLINSAPDYDGKIIHRKQYRELIIGELRVKVLFEADKEVYLQSTEGTKVMKPDPEFLNLLKISEKSG